MWEGDGKHLKIFINGEEFSYCWYAFIDQNTTLLVGSSLTGAESAESFLKALKDGKGKAGFFAMGVLIDNRLTMDEKRSAREFCAEHGIVLVNTFPGNAKSNGIIEGNFSIFEKQVGAVHVQGTTPEEIARSLARNVIEIFTQQRNHGPRKRLGGRTPFEAADGVTRPEHQRSDLERLRDRLLRNELSLEAKMQLIEDLIPRFETMSEESKLKFKHELKPFSADEIMAAKARFTAQQSKHPEAFYRSEYFLAILRYKREENAKAAFNAAFRASHQALGAMTAGVLRLRDPSQVVIKIVAFLTAAADRPGTSHLLMSLESLCWALIDIFDLRQLPLLWRQIESAIQRCRDISLRKWQVMSEFIHEHIGRYLYDPPGARGFANAAVLAEMQI